MAATIRHSVCALDCPDACSLLVTVEGERATRLRGNPEHPVTRGFLCAKVARYLEREYSPERLLYPQRRVGAKGEGRFERISWDDALQEIAEKLGNIASTYGPEAILPYSYAGTMGLLNGSGMDRRFFHRLGASRLDRTICSSAGGVGLESTQGFRYGLEPEQFSHAKLIIAWGANILGTNVHLWPFILEARRQGARFVVIDPVRNRTGALADRHYPIYPGSDAALAFAMMHVILEEDLWDRDYVSRHTTGVEQLRELVRGYSPEHASSLTGIPAVEIAELAREYATTQPSAIRLNYGIQRSERGGLSVQAVSLLPVLTGAWKYAGGGMQLSTSAAFAFNRPALERPDLQTAALGREARVLNMSELGRVLDEVFDPPVRALFIYNSNPAAIAPHQSRVRAGLAREDLFTVVIEQMQTDTADYADILLPATTFLEHTDLYYAYGHYYVQLARPALPAPGEARSNVEIFRALAARMGFDEACFRESDDEMIRALLNSGHPFLGGITLEELGRNHSMRLRISPPGEPFLPFAEGNFGTPTGKVDLTTVDRGYLPPVESRLGDATIRSRYPLELISPKCDDAMNSTFGNRAAVDAQTAVLSIAEEDAHPRGIQSGDQVRVYNDRGSLLLQADVNDAVRTGVVRVPAVRWPKRALDGQGVNCLTSGRLTDLGGGAVFYSCLVEVHRCD